MQKIQKFQFGRLYTAPKSTYKADLSGAIDAVNKLREKYDVHISLHGPLGQPFRMV